MRRERLHHLIEKLARFAEQIPCYFGFHGKWSRLLFRDKDRSVEHRECLRCNGIFTVTTTEDEYR